MPRERTATPTAGGGAAPAADPPWDPADPDLLAATTFRRLHDAYRAARRHKPKTAAMDRFDLRLEPHLLALQRALRDGSWQPGPYRQFEVRDPKPRLVSAASFADRVVHHALMRAAEPYLAPALGPEVYANRKGMGTHAAIARYQELARTAPYVLKLDVAAYFPSIDHDILLAQLQSSGLPAWNLTLLSRVVLQGPPSPRADVHFPGDDLLAPLQRRRGLPLGNLTSQTLANLYLAPVDAVLRRHPDVVGFIRYVDDLAVVGRSRAGLRRALAETIAPLHALRLRWNRSKLGIHAVHHGVSLLGMVVQPDHQRLPGRARRRFEARIRPRIRAWARGALASDDLWRSFAAWHGHARRGMSDGALRRFYARRVALRRLDNSMKSSAHPAPASGSASCAAAPGTTTNLRTSARPTATTTNR